MSSPSHAASHGSRLPGSPTSVLLALGAAGALICWLRLRDRAAAGPVHRAGPDRSIPGDPVGPGAAAGPVRAGSGGAGVVTPPPGPAVPTVSSSATCSRVAPDRRAAALHVFVPAQRAPSD